VHRRRPCKTGNKKATSFAGRNLGRWSPSTFNPNFSKIARLQMESYHFFSPPPLHSWSSPTAWNFYNYEPIDITYNTIFVSFSLTSKQDASVNALIALVCSNYNRPVKTDRSSNVSRFSKFCPCSIPVHSKRKKHMPLLTLIKDYCKHHIYRACRTQNKKNNS
jgi:hypothetical protein